MAHLRSAPGRSAQRHPRRARRVIAGLAVVAMPAVAVERLVEANYLATAITLAILACFGWATLAFVLRAMPDLRPDLRTSR